jgi:hypothetical protein
VGITPYSTALLYSLLAVLTAGFGVGILVWQTGSSQHAVTTRRGNVVGGVLLIIIGGVVLLTQIWAIVNASYSTMG